MLVYDAGDTRNQDALKICRRYLHWVQNSVFEGPLTPAQLRLLQADLTRALDQTADSVIVYLLADGTAHTREVWGIEKGNTDNLL